MDIEWLSCFELAVPSRCSQKNYLGAVRVQGSRSPSPEERTLPEQLRILSIDGGGIRGLIPARILAELEERVQKPCSDVFDYIAGTSTGGILAAGLACPDPARGGPKFRARDLAELYRKEGATIFSRSLCHEIEALGSLLGPKYPARGRERVLHEFFGEARLGEVRTRILLTAYEIERRSPFFFKSWRAGDPGYDFLLRDVAAATSAAPTYFPPSRITARDGRSYALVDGGVFANNPTLCLLSDVWHQHPGAEVLVLSLGTGNLDEPIEYARARGWGLAGWARPLIATLIDGVSDTVDYEARELIRHVHGERNYCRLQGDLDQHQELDDVTPAALDSLERAAVTILKENSSTFEAFCARLARPRGV
jgi:patatin-like phospholipase/acyl hydrolase